MPDASAILVSKPGTVRIRWVMKRLPSLVLAATLALGITHPSGLAHSADPAPAGTAGDAAAVRQEFIAAMQRLQSPASQTTQGSEPPDSQALRSYVIYDYSGGCPAAARS